MVSQFGLPIDSYRADKVEKEKKKLTKRDLLKHKITNKVFISYSINIDTR